MSSVGHFEARARLSEICTEVAAKGVAVLVTRRGKPLVRIEPIRPAKAQVRGVWDRRAALGEDFTPPPRSRQTWRNPLEDCGR